MIPNELVESVISNIPNFIGFVILAYVLSQNNTRYLEIIERILEHCFDEESDIESLTEELP